MQETTYRGTGSVYNSPGVSVVRPGACQRHRVVARKKTSGVLQRRGETRLQREPMAIPADRPLADTGLAGCGIIHVSYYITVSAAGPQRLRQRPGRPKKILWRAARKAAHSCEITRSR